MNQTLIRAALALCISAALAACGSDEPQAPAEPSNNAVVDAPGTTTPATLPQLAPQSSAYERAQRALATATSLRFEAEFASKDGNTQYLTGARQAQNYTFNVRTAPKPSADFDGPWLLQSGKYLKQTPAGFEAQLAVPDGHVALAAVVTALPDKDTALTPASGASESVAGVACAPRTIDLSQLPNLAMGYNKLGVCIDEANAQIVRIDAEARTGDRLLATFSGYGEAVEMPNAEVKEWWQQYPRQQ